MILPKKFVIGSAFALALCLSGSVLADSALSKNAMKFRCEASTNGSIFISALKKKIAEEIQAENPGVSKVYVSHKSRQISATPTTHYTPPYLLEMSGVSADVSSFKDGKIEIGFSGSVVKDAFPKCEVKYNVQIKASAKLSTKPGLGVQNYFGQHTETLTVEGRWVLSR